MPPSHARMFRRPPRWTVPAAAVLLVAVARRHPAPLAAAAAAWWLARSAKPAKPPAAPDPTETELRRQLQAVQEQASSAADQAALTASRLRHDVRGALSPALLLADRLSMAEEPDKKRAGEMIARAVGRAVDLLRRPAEH